MEDWVHRVGADVLETNCSFLPGKFLLLRQLDTCVAYYVGDEDLGDLYVCSDCTVIPATCLWAASAQLYLQDLSVGSVCAIIPAGPVCGPVCGQCLHNTGRTFCGQRLHTCICRTFLWAAFTMPAGLVCGTCLDSTCRTCCTIPAGLVCRQRLHSYTCRTSLWDALAHYLQDLSVGSVYTIPAGPVCEQRLHNTCRTCLWTALAQYLQDMSVSSAFRRVCVCSACTIPAGLNCLCAALAQYLQDLSVSSACTVPAGLVCEQRF